MSDRPVDRELRGSQKILGLQEETAVATLNDEGSIVTRAPGKEPETKVEWIKANLFSSPFNSILTIVFGLLAVVMLYQFTKFLFFTGSWDVFRRNTRSYMVGRWPLEEIWRVWTVLYALALLGGITRGMSRRPFLFTRLRLVTISVIAAFVLFVLIYVVETALMFLLLGAVPALIALGVLIGFRFGRKIAFPVSIAWILAFPVAMVIFLAFDGVSARLWGGFTLNVIVASVSIFASFPLGLLLALGRRSSLPVIRLFSIGFIELIRGAPLYVLLISGAFLVPLLFPPGMTNLPLIMRAMIIFTLFSAVYVAEIVRGGLQGVHFGQYEASRALGLSVTRMMALVILPQALRATIPAMISHFISLWKDTSLLAVIGGFTDLARAARRASAGGGEAGNSLEALLPAAALFFAVAFLMSRWSQRLERRVGVGER